jgi:hypothetical protein
MGFKPIAMNKNKHNPDIRTFRFRKKNKRNNPISIAIGMNIQNPK